MIGEFLIYEIYLPFPRLKGLLLFSNNYRFISFNNIPLDDNISNSLGELNIELDKRTIIFDYIWSKIPLSNLCDLVELEEVKSVFTLHNK